MDSTTVMLSNLAMDEQRKVYFSEIDNMGKGTPLPPSPIPTKPAIKTGNAPRSDRQA
jgi:hypothetical protein